MAETGQPLQAYLDDHQIYAMLQQSQEALVRNYPSNPVEFLRNYYAKTPLNQNAVRDIKKIIFLGPPGCGKGTQAKYLCQQYQLTQISPGNLLRTEISNQTQIGVEAQDYVKNGKLVPDSIIIDLVSKCVKQLPSNKGWLLDGFPRTELQAYALKADNSLIPTHIFEFLVDEEEIIQRLSSRRFDPVTGNTYNLKSNPPSEDIVKRCITREDDKESVIKDRFRIYNCQLQGIRNVFGHQISYIQSEGKSISEISEILEQKLKAAPQIKNQTTKEILPRGPGIVDQRLEQEDMNRAMMIVDKPEVIEVE